MCLTKTELCQVILQVTSFSTHSDNASSIVKTNNYVIHGVETALLCHCHCQIDQTHKEAHGQRGEAVYQDPADTQRDAGQEGELSGICEYLT